MTINDKEGSKKMEKLSDEKIKEIQDLYANGQTMEDIAKQLNCSKGVVQKYVQQDLKTKREITEPPQVQQTVQPEQAQPVQQVQLKPARALTPPYPEVPEPVEWLQTFLENYRMKEQFIQIQCNRVRMRDELPHPTDLMTDMKEMDSGQKNLRQISYLVEDYSYQLDKYLKQRENEQTIMSRRRHGIPIGNRQKYPEERRGIPLRGRAPEPSRYDDDYPRDDFYPRERPPQESYRRIRDQYNPYQQQEAYPYPRLETELERFARMQQLFQKTEEKHPQMERLEKANEKLEQKLTQMEEDKRRELLEETIATRAQLQQEHTRRQDLENQVRTLEFSQSQKGLSETDLRYEEIKDQHTLELRKLDEKGKTREAIANAVKTGFSQVGQAIFRTAQELGTEDTRPMQGVTDNRHMWQANCPYCNAPITAPLSAKVIQCPECGRQLEVSQEQATPGPATLEPRKEPQPPPVEKTPPMSIAECPYCKKTLSIPPNVEIVECPYCKKRLEVTGTPNMPVVPYLEPQEPDVTPMPEIVTGPEAELQPEPASTNAEASISIPVDTTDALKYQRSGDLVSEAYIHKEEFTPKEKGVIEKSLEDAKEGRISPLEIEEYPKVKKQPEMPEPLPDTYMVETKPDQKIQFVCGHPDCGHGFETEMQLKGHILHHIKTRGKTKHKKR